MSNNKPKDTVAYCAKGIAVISIVSAHCATVPDSSSKNCHYISLFLDNFGTVGIGVFFFFAGLFFACSNHDYLEFLKNKITTILAPWLFCGSLVYLYVYLRKGGIALLSWIKWIIGDETYLYYMTIISVFYITLYFIRRHRIANIILCSLSIISILLTQYANILSSVNPYLNPFNFVIWFSLGILSAQKKEQLYNLCKKTRLITLIIVMLFSLLFVLFNIRLSYVKPYYIPCEIVSLCAIIGYSQGDKVNSLLSDLGRFSFPIYLLHMPIAGIITNITNRFCFWPIVMIRPAVVTMITFAFIWLVTKYIKGKPNRIISVLLGAR